MKNKKPYTKRIGALLLAFCVRSAAFPAPAAAEQDNLRLYFPIDEPEENVLSVLAAGDPNWYYDEPEMISLPLFELTGKGVTVGIIDSGIAEHNDIAAENIAAKLRLCADDTEDTDSADVADDMGHGTAVAGLICGRGKSENSMRGIAPDVNLVIVKCTNASVGGADFGDITAGIRYCVDQGCDVINISMGTAKAVNPDDYPVLQEMQEAINEAAQSGCIIVAAAGNKGSDANETDFVSYPAGFQNVIGVGSVGSGFTHASTSQKNESVFVSAPGSRVLVLNYKSPLGYKVDSGTSYAAPIISGMAALIKQMDKSATVDTVKEILKQTVTDCGENGYDTAFGYGVANGRALAIYLRNTNFWARKANGEVTVSNLGGARSVYFVQSAYIGARQAYALPESAEISDLSSESFSLQAEEESYTYKRFFLEQESLKPLGGAL